MALWPLLCAAVCLDGLLISLCIVQLSLLLRNRCQKRFEPIDILLFSLSVADLLCGLAYFGEDCIQLKAILLHSEISTTNISDIVMEFLFTLFILLSHFHVMCIAVERFVAVAFPMRYRVFYSNTSKVLTVCITWTLAIILSSVVVTSLIVYRKGKDKNKRYEVAQTISGIIYTIACCIVLITYLALFIALILHDRMVRELLPHEVRKSMQHRRNSYICLLLGLSFFVCVLPYSVGLLKQSLAVPVSSLLVTLNHVSNPIVYFIKYYMDGRRRRVSSVISLNTLNERRFSSPDL